MRVRLGEASGRWVIFAAVLGSGMAMLDATVVNVALPTIGRDLGATVGGLQMTINGYTLSLASLILLGGSLGDRYGRRRIFVLGALAFAAASLLCGVAPSVDFLIAARLLQGVGGALLTPGSLAMIAALFDDEERSRAIGIWSGLGGIAGAVGPFLGGWLIQAVGWRWVFFVNLPLAAVVVFVAQRHVPETSDPRASKRLDVAGAVLGAAALAGITFALLFTSESGASPSALAAGALGVVAFVAFVITERRSSHPMLPLELFGSRQFSAANAVTFVVYAALGGVFFFLVMELQTVAQYSAIAAGAALLPITAILLVLSGPAGDLAAKIGPRLPMSAGPALSGAGLLLMARIGPDASYWRHVLPAVVVFALGLALTVAPLTATVLGAAPARFAGIASGVNNAVARAGSLLAVAVLPMVAGVTGNDYRDPAAFHAGFRIVMLVCAVLLGAGALLAAVTIRNEPSRAKEPARRHCAIAGPPLDAPRRSQ